MILPHEIPDTTNLNAVIRAARDIRVKYTTHSNLLGEDDPYRTVQFLEDYTQRHKKYSVPVKSLQRAYKQFIMSIGEYVPYLETKDFLTKHFLGSLEETLDADLNLELNISRLRIGGNRTPHYLGLNLTSNGHLFLV